MWLFPWLTLLIIAFIIGIFAVMAIFPIQRVELLCTFDPTAFLVAVGAFLQKSEGASPHSRPDAAPYKWGTRSTGQKTWKK